MNTGLVGSLRQLVTVSPQLPKSPLNICLLGYVQRLPQSNRRSPPRSPMVRSLEQATMRKVYLRILPFAAADLFLLLSRPHQRRLRGADDEQGYRPDAGAYGMAAGAFFWGYVPVRGAEQHHPRKGRRAALDRRIMITWGIISGATAFATGPYSFMAIRFLLGPRRGGLVPRLRAVFHLLVPRPAPRPHHFRLHPGAADRGGARRAGLDRAAWVSTACGGSRDGSVCTSWRRSRRS